jgi:hypothetical protein
MRGVKRLPDGGVRVTVGAQEHAALVALPPQLRPIVAGEADDDLAEAIRGRLFPAAYADAELDAEFRQLAGEDLVTGRIEQLDAFERTLAAGAPVRGKVRIDLDADEAAAWLAVVNDTRLTLGTVLGITAESQWEGGPDPDDPASAMLWYLGWLEEELVAALMGSLDDGEHAETQ